MYCIERLEQQDENRYMTLTPDFDISQCDEYVTICIKVPLACDLSKSELFVEDTIFIFTAFPYFLRLNLPESILTPAQITDTNNLRLLYFKCPKAQPGLYFPGLHLLENLLKKPNDDWYIDQTHSFDNKSLEICINEAPRYGFYNQYRCLFKCSELSEQIKLPQPDQTSAEQRNELRLKSEIFNSNHYIADLYPEDDASYIDDALSWKLHITEADIQTDTMQYEPNMLRYQLTKKDKTYNKIRNSSEIQEIVDEKADAMQSELNDLQQYQIRERDECIHNKCNYETELCEELSKQVISHNCQHILIDLMFSYLFTARITLGEMNDSNEVNSWTITTLSPCLSYLVIFDDLKQLSIALYRRCLCFPLIRRFDLCELVKNDVVEILLANRQIIISTIKDLQFILKPDHFMLNLIFVDDCINWIQKQQSGVFHSLARNLKDITILKSDLGFDLNLIETMLNNNFNGGVGLEQTLFPITILENVDDSDDEV
ncbi:hypothetical protein GJ496_006901 [Pomphorhynchus laevis]|nr:hypothetical protein GJ496_006901 [Pomphorhynchus laevis]